MLKHVETTSFGLTLALFSERIHQYTSDVEVYYELVEAADLPSMNTLSNFPTAICRRLRPSQTISRANFASAGLCCSQAHREPFLLGRVTSASGQGHCQFSTGGWFPYVSTVKLVVSVAKPQSRMPQPGIFPIPMPPRLCAAGLS